MTPSELTQRIRAFGRKSFYGATIEERKAMVYIIAKFESLVSALDHSVVKGLWESDSDSLSSLALDMLEKEAQLLRFFESSVDVTNEFAISFVVENLKDWVIDPEGHLNHIRSQRATVNIHDNGVGVWGEVPPPQEVVVVKTTPPAIKMWRRYKRAFQRFLRSLSPN